MSYQQLLHVLLGFCLCSGAAWAESLALKAGHPEHYEVKRGDTLWDIAGHFLQHPYQWPQIWQGNPHIENPHWIYPGDRLVLTRHNGQPQIHLQRNLAKTGRDVKLYPRIRQQPLEKPIEVIPTEKIAKYLTNPKIVAEDELAKAPYIVAIAGEHVIAGQGNRVYVRGLEDAQNFAFTAFRPGATYVDGKTSEVLGYEGKFIANLNLEKAGDPSTLLITDVAREVLIGDRILPHSQGEFSLSFFPRPPAKAVEGQIISVMEGVSQIGQYDVVALDRGTVDGLEPGHVLDIYQQGEQVRDLFRAGELVQLPDELAGTLMVFRAFDRVSYALVLNAFQAMHVLDYVRTP
ncbi:MAG: LysM domain-containing protein [Methylococcales bacterium]|nr:LysM domain-containing protein [Methylococcales bacterium]